MSESSMAIAAIPGALASATDPQRRAELRHLLQMLEGRFRRMAKQRGWLLRKSRRRKAGGHDNGMYALLNANTGVPIHRENRAANSMYALTLGEVDSMLSEAGVA